MRRAHLIDSISSQETDAHKFNKNNELDATGSLREVQDDEKGAVATPVSGNMAPVNRFTLDTVIENEGSNLSVGERSLLSLARALVKDCKLVILDEAT